MENLLAMKYNSQDIALLYVRVSSKEQEKEGYSLDAQEKLGEEYALRNNFKIIKRWKVSESAWKEERTSFSEMLEYAKKHDNVKHIIFDVTDRMTRNDMDKIKIWSLIKLYDKTIHFSRSNKKIDKASPSEDEFMLDIEVAVAKKMSNDISRKSQMGMKEKAEQGFYPSTAPLGYRNNKITHLIDVNSEIAPFIKQAFSLMSTGSYSLNMLCDRLYEEGFRGKKGNRVGKSALDHFLKNPIYYGTFRWKGNIYQGNHEAIISKELFDSVQGVLNGNNHPSLSRKSFAFNNLIRCGICDCKILGEQKKKLYNYYHCTFSKGRHNGVGYIKEDKLANMFEEPILGVTLKQDLVDWLKEALKRGSKNTLKLHENRLNSLQKQYDRVNNRLSRLFDMKLDADVSEDIFKTKEQEYKTQLIEIKSQMDNVKAINPNFYGDGCKILELSKSLHSQYIKGNYEEKAKMARLIASNYTLNYASLSPTYRKPFSFFTKRASRPNWLPREDSNLGLTG
ncbi:recombinase family protein [Candidatus Omnitrophota bacterium]